MALVGDYSPRTERILPPQNRFGKRLFSSAFGTVDFETVALRLDVAVPHMLFDEWLVTQEVIRHHAQFAA